MNVNILYSCIYLFGILISSFAQLLLKKATLIKYNSKIKEYLNFKMIFAYFLFFSATILSVISYKKIALSIGTLLGISEYIFITIISYLFLKEKISFKKIIGLFFILIGTIIYFL